MKKIVLTFVLIFFSSQLFSKNVYSCSGQATMCVRKVDNVWRADVCDSSSYLFIFNDNHSELKYEKLIGRKNGVDQKVTEVLKCKTVSKVSQSRNKRLLGASNGRITCIDFDGRQLGIPEIVEEVINFSHDKERFVVYPMHSHSFLMNGDSPDTATYGTCSKLK